MIRSEVNTVCFAVSGVIQFDQYNVYFQNLIPTLGAVNPSHYVQEYVPHINDFKKGKWESDMIIEDEITLHIIIREEEEEEEKEEVKEEKKWCTSIIVIHLVLLVSIVGTNEFEYHFKVFEGSVRINDGHRRLLH